jgi:hypothetical protein
MYRKFINALVYVTTILFVAVPVVFATEPSGKTRAAADAMGTGVGAMQGREIPAGSIPTPALSDSSARQGILQLLEAEKGVGAMQGREPYAQSVPAPQGSSARQEILRFLEAEKGVGAMQGR